MTVLIYIYGGTYIKGIQHYAISKAPEIRQTKIYTQNEMTEEKGIWYNSEMELWRATERQNT